MAKVHVQLKIRPAGELTEIDDSEIPNLLAEGFLTREAADAAVPVTPEKDAAPASSKPAVAKPATAGSSVTPPSGGQPEGK